MIKESSLAPSENSRRPERNVKERNGRKKYKERSQINPPPKREERAKRTSLNMDPVSGPGAVRRGDQQGIQIPENVSML